MSGMGWALGKGKRSPDVLRDILTSADPDDLRTRIPAHFDWPEPPPLTITSDGEEGLAGLLFTGRYPLAVALGWHCEHIRDSRGGILPGFPDWVLTREVLIFVELKRERDRLNPDQVRYAKRLMNAGAWYELWRPGDWDRIGAILTTGQRPMIDGR